MTSITVELADFRAALASVVVHADPDPEITSRHRIRLDIGGENVTVTATQGYTAALAIVSVQENHDGELSGFDLLPGDVKKILGLFKLVKDGLGQAVRVDVTDQHVKVTDVSGLFDGEALTLLRVAVDDAFPEVAALVAASMRKERGSTDRLWTTGALVKHFTAAASAYGEALVIEPTHGRALLVSCGESFLGLLMPRRVDEDDTARLDGWRRAWRERLRDVGFERAGVAS